MTTLDLHGLGFADAPILLDVAHHSTPLGLVALPSDDLATLDAAVTQVLRAERPEWDPATTPLICTARYQRPEARPTGLLEHEVLRFIRHAGTWVGAVVVPEPLAA